MTHHSQLLKHRCGWPSCGKLVPLSQWGCREHWYTLPRELRVNLVLSYMRGIDEDTHPTANYLQAHRAAIAWIEEQFKEVAAHNPASEAIESEDNERPDIP